MTNTETTRNEKTYAASLAVVRAEGVGSVSLLQRKLGLPYTEASAMMEHLVRDGILGASSASHLRIICQPRPARSFTCTPEEQRVRLLRDLALYLVECNLRNVGPDSRCTGMILHPLKVRLKELRDATITGTFTPVFDTARKLASLESLQGPWSDHVQDRLLSECQPFGVRWAALSTDAEGLDWRFQQLTRYLEKRLLDGWGAHTRAFEAFIPDALVPTGVGRMGGGYREHVVPCIVLRDKANELLTSGVRPELVADYIRPYLAIVQITDAQADLLDNVFGMKTTMPANWDFETGCPFARLHTAGIEFDAPRGFEHCRCVSAQAQLH